MSTDYLIEKLDRIEKMLSEQTLLQKEILNFHEAAIYLDVSPSHLYKMTSASKVPYYKPNNKKIYFTRKDLDVWILSNRQSSIDETLLDVNHFQLKPGRR
jgi:excisionase family DNA binding protein